MATFYLVRHGEADYSEMLEKGFYGFGRSFAPLSEKGIGQAEAAALDERLKSAELIVSSPYTRALQTAAIISRETGLKLCVEVDLHEWEPDKTNQYTTSEEAFSLTREFNLHKGVYPEGQEMKWETLEEVRKRMRKVADKYAGYNKVIFVGHGMAFRTLTYIEQMKPAEIVECTYHTGQDDCVYSFY
ncbi:MAG: histidine phosphatase family protein [Lachnospiraceae bacterium]|nr:histidine phosphatase family protein [Lachnospiraceae bacterium]